MHATMMDNLPLPVMELEALRDEAGNMTSLKFTWVNATAQENMSLDGGALVGRTLCSIHPDIKNTHHYRAILEAVQKKELRSIMVRSVHNPKYFGRFLQFIINPSEYGCVIIVNDVTDIGTERDNARRQHKMMEAACDDAVNGIAIANQEQKIVYANPALHKSLGYNPGELLGLKIRDMVAESDDEDRRRAAKKMLNAEISQYVTDRTYLAKDGTEILMSVAVSSTHGSDGQQLSLAHFRDVREERAAQKDLAEALERAEESTRLKSEFLANMSHEIRTPLNGVIGMAQVLSHSELSPEQAEHLDIIRDSSGNLMTLLNDILDLSKIESGKIEIEAIDADIRHKIKRNFRLLATTAREKGVACDLVVHPGVPSSLRFDPVRLGQCVTNLLSNAIKFTHQGRIIAAVSGQREGNLFNLVIHVSDSGIGIPEDKRAKIFQSFEQADGSTTRGYGGTGLGLTITRYLVELMGGELSVVSEVGKGSVFTLKVPCEITAGQKSSNDADVTSIATPNLQPGRVTGKRVLVVDDNVVNRRVVSTFLEAYGMEAHAAIDGLDALEQLQDNEFDLVLLDIHMPKLDGVQTLKRLRKNDVAMADGSVIALTADAMIGDKEKYLEAGFDGYVAKPINERDLISEVTRILGLDSRNVRADWSAVG